MIATILLAAVHPPAAWLVQRADRVQQVSDTLVHHVHPELGDRAAWWVGFAVVFAVGLITFVGIKRAREVLQRRYGARARGRWAVVAWSVLAIVFLDALLTGFVFWLHTLPI